MSGEPKTLTLTPEEILLAARDKDFMLVPTRSVETRELRWSLHKVTVVGSHREIDYLAGFDTLSQAGAWLLGVPVVARDEAAGLRAEVEGLEAQRDRLRVEVRRVIQEAKEAQLLARKYFQKYLIADGWHDRPVSIWPGDVELDAETIRDTFHYADAAEEERW